MYNRYIPQPDGTYRKNRVHEPVIIPEKRKHDHSEQEECEKPQKQVEPESCAPLPCPPQTQQVNRKEPVPQHTDAGDFLRRLLPKDLDTGDLLIIILLLLMSGDCKEDKNTALLTLALYFFL